MDFDLFHDQLPMLPLVEICKSMQADQLIPLSLYSPRWRNAMQQRNFKKKCQMDVEMQEDLVRFTIRGMVPIRSPPVPNVRLPRANLRPPRPHIRGPRPVPRAPHPVLRMPIWIPIPNVDYLQRVPALHMHYERLIQQFYVNAPPPNQAPTERLFEMTVSFESLPDVEDQVQISFENNRIRCYARNFSTVETTCRQWIRTMETIFEPLYYTICMDTGAKPPHFNVEVLSILPPGEVKSLRCQTAEHVVNSRHITDFLERVKFTANAETVFFCNMDDKVVRNDRIILRSQTMDIADARFVSCESLRTLEIEHADFGRNCLTSADFNAFLRNWKQKRSSNVEKLEFRISDDQDIRMEEVVKGLDAQEWDSEARDRCSVEFFDYPDMYEEKPTVVDFRDGLDVKNADGKLATILLTNQKLIFCVWNDRRQVQDYEKRLNERLDRWQCELKQLESDMKRHSERPERVAGMQAEVREREERIRVALGLLARIQNEWM